MDNTTPGCAVGVIENGNWALLKSYGMANLEHGLALDTRSVFRMGSVGKQFTAAAIAHAARAGHLSLDDPEWKEGQAPHEIGRAQFGRISIANTDSEAIALMDAAFDAAFRAVEEQTRNAL